jgi:hypothetical protein
MIEEKKYVYRNFYEEKYIFSFEEIECFDIALIHDTRTGSQVSLPHVKQQIKFEKTLIFV